MGMSTHVIGFRPPDSRWQAMKTVWDACWAAGVPVPEEVEDFFDGTEPDAHGVEVSLETVGAIKEWGDKRGRAGYELDVSKLPKGVTVVRFFNSW
jgi:hypothetical protein